MTFQKPTGNLQYRMMDSAPTDGTVIMGLCGRKYPEAIYYAAGAWHYWHLAAGTACDPRYWCRLPGDTPSDYASSDVATP